MCRNCGEETGELVCQECYREKWSEFFMVLEQRSELDLNNVFKQAEQLANQRMKLHNIDLCGLNDLGLLPLFLWEVAVES